MEKENKTTDRGQEAQNEFGNALTDFYEFRGTPTVTDKNWSSPANTDNTEADALRREAGGR